jgi:hypothetical protein
MVELRAQGSLHIWVIGMPRGFPHPMARTSESSEVRANLPSLGPKLPQPAEATR